MIDELTMKITPGACQMETTIHAVLEDDMTVTVKMESGCSCINNMSDALEPIDPMVALHMPFAENPIYVIGGKYIKHASCPIPLGVIKCVEAVTGMAVRKDVHLEYD